MDKDKQLSALADLCKELPVMLSFGEDHRSITVTIPPPWDMISETKALNLQEKIKEWSKRYPDVILYCFDSFSTLLYVM